MAKKSKQRRAILRQRKQDRKDQRIATLVAIRMKHGNIPELLKGAPMWKLEWYLGQAVRVPDADLQWRHDDIRRFWIDEQANLKQEIIDRMMIYK